MAVNNIALIVSGLNFTSAGDFTNNSFLISEAPTT